MSFTIAGIHTGTGKTVCSAVLTEALGYDYWKPVQAGDLENSDSVFISKYISNTKSKVHREAYRLTIAASPHYAAMKDNTEITPEKLILPETENELIIETAGGIMSPLSDTFLNLDLIKQLDLPVILVSDNYLGSINHTLLSIEILKNADVDLTGIIFCGEEIKSTREFIIQYSKLPLLLSIPQFSSLDKKTISDFASAIKDELENNLNEFSRKR